MGFFFIVLFIFVPLLEIIILISVGGVIGLWPTVAIIILTAFIGAILLKRQGLKTLIRAQNQFNKGQFPIDEIFETLCFVCSAILLITPGFFTDSVGLLLFVTSFRILLKKIVTNTLIARSDIHIYTGNTQNKKTNVDQKIIDGEFEEIKSVDDNDLSPKLKR